MIEVYLTESYFDVLDAGALGRWSAASAVSERFRGNVADVTAGTRAVWLRLGTVPGVRMTPGER
jgi:hypothetical protein